MNSRKRKSTLLILLFTISFFAQTNYEKGYVIKTNGEKIEGLILNKDWLYAPDQIIFKSNLESETISINEKDIKKIEIDEKFVFERFTVDIQRYSNNLNNLDDSRVTDLKKESLLLELLVEGEVSL
ncbi:hypothetical protein LPB03_03955 [Polaribacter vadi]|uniref:Uncharacterized protein n=1 Tax=Polaribacter vadi TaxID=1774273 RepID=A0A1B8TXN1_9FLAO|nr:hypothetical protein [Polaribacter vadi]AOW16670.1 hypothetical protein LPB03_03955 [Polaribacter vadi]OBY64423.1 hypothetical protein LPB3_08540 [Polaribacter vadi]